MPTAFGLKTKATARAQDAGVEIDAERLIARYGGRTPRYTSYPTAVQFHAGVDSKTYGDWLAAIEAKAGPVSLYAHIPFCDRMCWYCGCHTSVVNRHAPVADYVGWLLQEIDLVAGHLKGRLPASAIHFGGGTPNMLATDEIVAILERFRARFDLTGDCEIAVEIDPRLLTRDWAQAAASAGLNRASLGVQDFDADVQAAINRVQPYDLVANSVEILREAGVTSLNLDLIYGLPRQTLEGLGETLEKALSLKPDRLSLFGYAHVPWMKAHQKLIADDDLPNAATRYAMQRYAADWLEARGWIRLGLDHFARPDDPLARIAVSGALRRNFQGYTTDQASTLLGFGASAISRTPHGYCQNASATPQWRDAIRAGAIPTQRGVAVTPDDQFRGDIIERLMCDLEVDLSVVARAHGRDLSELADAEARLSAMEHDGLLTRNGAHIRATPTGRDFVRSIAAVFDAHLAADTGRHSTGV